MPDQGVLGGEDVPAAVEHHDRTLSAMGERVAVVETQLREALPVIRSNIHGINNELQKVVAQGERCDRNLELILAKLGDLPTIALSASTFTAIHPELRALLKEREQSLGLAAFGRRLARIAVAGSALVAMLAGIGAFFIWLAQYVKPV